MCTNHSCLCHNANPDDWSELFMNVWDSAFSVQDEVRILRDPEIKYMIQNLSKNPPKIQG